MTNETKNRTKLKTIALATLFLLPLLLKKTHTQLDILRVRGKGGVQVMGGGGVVDKPLQTCACIMSMRASTSLTSMCPLESVSKQSNENRSTSSFERKRKTERRKTYNAEVVCHVCDVECSGTCVCGVTSVSAWFQRGCFNLCL
jgi:hypothetical protein